MSVDNLNEAQRLVDFVADYLYDEPGVSVEVQLEIARRDLEIARTRALIDIARSLRSLDSQAVEGRFTR